MIGGFIGKAIGVPFGLKKTYELTIALGVLVAGGVLPFHMVALIAVGALAAVTVTPTLMKVIIQAGVVVSAAVNTAVTFLQNITAGVLADASVATQRMFTRILTGVHVAAVLTPKELFKRIVTGVQVAVTRLAAVPTFGVLINEVIHVAGSLTLVQAMFRYISTGVQVAGSLVARANQILIATSVHTNVTLGRSIAYLQTIAVNVLTDVALITGDGAQYVTIRVGVLAKALSDSFVEFRRAVQYSYGEQKSGWGRVKMFRTNGLGKVTGRWGRTKVK